MNGIGKFTLVRDFGNAIELPERVVLTDNGCYDLAKQGKSGYYAWIGYKHDESGRSEAKMNNVIRKTAQDIAKYWKEQYGKEAVVEDFIHSVDMYRVHICN